MAEENVIASEEAKEQAVDVESTTTAQGEGQTMTPFALDYEVTEGEKYRTIINAPSADLALQEFVKIAASPNHILALKLDEKQTDTVTPVLLKLSSFDRITVLQLGVAQIPTAQPEEAPKAE